MKFLAYPCHQALDNPFVLPILSTLRFISSTSPEETSVPGYSRTNMDKPLTADTLLTNQAIGYRLGLSQPTKAYSLKFKQPGEVNFKELDRALTTHFEVDLVAARYESHLLSKSNRAMIEAAWRVLQVSNTLMQAARIPVFEPGRIVDLQPSGNDQLTLTVLMPAIDFIGDKIRQASLQTAVELICDLSLGHHSSSKVPDLQNFAHERFVEPVKRMSSGDSIIPLLGALYDTGVPFRHLGMGAYQIGWGAHCMLVRRSAFEADSAIGSVLSQNKYMATIMMRAAGLPAPENAIAENAEDAVTKASALGWPVVVKPQDRDRGEGVSVDLHDGQSIIEAYHHAAKIGSREQVLVERQVKGVCHRCYVQDGHLLYVTKRLPKSVKGDGQSSVEELIEKANSEEMQKPVWSRLKPFPKDSLALECIKRAGYQLNSMPAQDAWVPLRPIQSTQDGGVVEDMTESIHRDNIDIAVRAARLFRLHSAGIDIITEDITRSWRETDAIVNEVNYSPLIGRRSTDEDGGYLAKLAARLVPEKGRIPVEVYVGGSEAWEKAVERQRQLLAENQPFYLSSHNITLEPDSTEVVYKTRSLYRRALSLLMDQRVRGVVLVIHNDEFEQTGLPVDQLSAVISVDNEVIVLAHDTLMAKDHLQRFVNLLKQSIRQ